MLRERRRDQSTDPRVGGRWRDVDHHRRSDRFLVDLGHGHGIDRAWRGRQQRLFLSSVSADGMPNIDKFDITW